MWSKAALAAIVLCIATLAPGQEKSAEAPVVQTPMAAGQKKSTEAPNDKVVQILRTPNKAQVNKFVCEAIPIRNTNPFNIINFFWVMTSREAGGVYSFTSPDGKSGYIVVICPEYQLESLRKLAAELDRPNQNSAPKSMYIYHRLRHRNVADPGFLTASQYWVGSSGILWPDVETNSVLIYDAPAGAKAAEKGFDEVLDKPLQQVELDVNVYEVDVNNDGTLGLDFQAWKNGPGRNLGSVNASGAYLHASGVPRTHFSASSGGYFLDYPSAFFDALAAKGKAVSLVKTRVAAVNRVPAVLTADEKVIYYQVTDPETNRQLTGTVTPAAVNGLSFQTDGRAFPADNARSPYSVASFLKGQAPRIGQAASATIKPVDTGIFLTAVPVVGEGMINVDLKLSLVTHTGFDGTGAPTLNSREICNSIAVAPEEEIIFGGLVRERKVQETRKVPLLGSLPGIGFLFGGEITTNKKTVVVASVQPHLVADHDNVTQDDRDAVAKTAGEKVLVLPQSEFCFEQKALIH